MSWSDTATWGGVAAPGDGAAVVIPAGRTVVLTGATASLGDVRVDGTLLLGDGDVQVRAASITVGPGGVLQAGTETAPYTHQATITLTGQPGATNDGVSRGLRVLGGTLRLHGVSPRPTWTKLNEHAAAGATSLTFKDSVDWAAGSRVVIAPTDHYGVTQTEVLTLASGTGTSVRTSTALAKARWGRLQYATAAGLSLVPDPDYAPPMAPAPTSLDERAAVGNLSRNIVIQGADDTAWQSQGHGAHVMVMDLASKVEVDAVEFRRVGQAGKLGRYPMHWHLLSYDVSTGTELGDATGHYIRNSAIWDSANRCLVLHATNGVSVRDNICYDIKGHAFFLEDAVERRNVFDGNLALKMRVPATANLLKIHERTNFQNGPSGFWMTNPDNTLTNNLAADAEGNGIWLSFPLRGLGLSRNVNLWPRYLPLGKVESNTVHTARGPGMLLEWVPVDDNVPHPENTLGTLAPQMYLPMGAGKPCLNSQGDVDDWCSDRIRFTIKRTTSFKNLDGAYRNRVSLPDYLEWAVADNVGQALAGAATDGHIERALIVGKSLNHQDALYPRGALPPAGLATYHSAVDMKDNTFVNLPFVDGVTSGAFSADDYYMSAVELGTVRNAGSRLINSAAGYRNLQPNLQTVHNAAENWALSGAILDAEGLWGPQGWFTVPNVSFLTAGAGCVDAQPVGKNGKSCPGPYYGIGAIQTDFDNSRFTFASAINVSRQDGTGRELGTWRIEDGYAAYRDPAVAASYACDTRLTPPAGAFCSWKLGHMRHFAARNGARYVLTFPGRQPPKWVAFNISNAYRTSDAFVMAVSFDGRLDASAYLIAGAQYQREQPMFSASMRNSNQARVMIAGSSLADVTASDGAVLWQDRANNLVWFKHRGGLNYPNAASLPPNDAEALYRTYSVVVYPGRTCANVADLGACWALLAAMP
ncbi:MAG: G8 domain-containing protein [Burkholderiales bacterium]